MFLSPPHPNVRHTPYIQPLLVCQYSRTRAAFLQAHPPITQRREQRLLASHSPRVAVSGERLLSQSCGVEGPTLRANLHVRSITDKDGGVIFDVKKGRFHGLNKTSAIAWETLKQNPNGVKSAQILHALRTAFGPHPRMADDLETLLSTFERNDFLRRIPTAGQQTDHASQTRADIDQLPAARVNNHVVSNLAFDFSGSTEPTKCNAAGLWTCAAWLSFTAVYLILWIGGFSRLRRVLRWFSAKRPMGVASEEKISRVCFAVNKAAAYYVRQSWCLQRAAVTYSLLRLAGIPAQLVIGCQRVPFYSHAWVEIHQAVVNDKAAVKERYSELDRF